MYIPELSNNNKIRHAPVKIILLEKDFPGRYSVLHSSFEFLNFPLRARISVCETEMALKFNFLVSLLYRNVYSFKHFKIAFLNTKTVLDCVVLTSSQKSICQLLIFTKVTFNSY